MRGSKNVRAFYDDYGAVDVYRRRLSLCIRTAVSFFIILLAIDENSSAQNGYKQEEGSEVPSSYASSTDAFVRRRPVS